MGLSTIQWCDFTENFWLGCRFATLLDGTHIEECWHCYAKLLDDNRYSKIMDGGTKEQPVSHWGSGPRHRTSEANWNNPRVWNRKAICTACGFAEWIGSDDCRQCGRNFSAENRRRPRVFSLSLGDWLDDEVPIEWLADMLRVIHDTPHLDWLLLTKRPQNFAQRMEDAFRFCTIEQPMPLSHTGLSDPRFLNWMTEWHVQDGCEEGEPDRPPANVWIGVSAGADQEAALAIPARIHFLSCEPMLRPMDTTHAARFDWVIMGGESGSKARPCHINWIRDGLKFCRENSIAPFVKQLGSNAAWDRDESKRYLKDSHGGDPLEWPEALRIREFPDEKGAAK